MSLQDFLTQLDTLASDAQSAFTRVASAAELDAARVEFLGARQGRLKAIQKCLSAVPADDRKEAGRRFNEVKAIIQAAYDQASHGVTDGNNRPKGPSLDCTLPGPRRALGHLHPITQTIESLKEIMARLGFAAVEGPEVEDEWHNFEALNIPLAHPARDPLDNFFLATAQAGSTPLMLRSQTSTVQIRVMENTPPPIRIISLGRVYRPDDVDATHYPMFHQMEGLYVDRDVTMAELKSVLKMFASAYLGKDVAIRFRPSFFPFTEPSVEVDFQWNDSWVEFGGAGMVDPNVLASVKYDPEVYSGFAFGLGVERLCMRRHNITDIRELYRNDVRFLNQFI